MCNHWFSGKVIHITYSDKVLLALGIQNAIHMRHIVIGGLPGSRIFFPWSHKRHNFLKKQLLNIKFLFRLPPTFIWSISQSKKNCGIYKKKVYFFTKSTRYSCPLLMKIEFSLHIFEKYPNVKFHEDQSSDSRVFPCGHTYGQVEGQTERTKPIATFSNFANGLKTEFAQHKSLHTSLWRLNKASCQAGHYPQFGAVIGKAQIFISTPTFVSATWISQSAQWLATAMTVGSWFESTQR
jgi:hypothetical protein